MRDFYHRFSPPAYPSSRPSLLYGISLSLDVSMFICVAWPVGQPSPKHTQTHTLIRVFWWSQLPDASQQQQWKQQQQKQRQQQQWQQQLQTTYINRFNEIPVKPNSQQPGQVRAVSMSKIWLEAAASDRASAAASAAATAARSKCQASERFLSEGVADCGTGSYELERAMEQADRTLQKVKKSLRAQKLT